MESKEKTKSMIMKILIVVIIICCIIGIIYVFSSALSEKGKTDENKNDTNIVLPEEPKLPGEPEKNTIPKMGE